VEQAFMPSIDARAEFLFNIGLSAQKYIASTANSSSTYLVWLLPLPGTFFSKNIFT
jgi:hypothetical protein